MEKEGRVFVKFGSHRTRDYGLRLIERLGAQGYYSWSRNTGHGVYEVTEDELKLLKEMIKRGTPTRFKDGDDLMKCWR